MRKDAVPGFEKNRLNGCEKGAKSNKEYFKRKEKVYTVRVRGIQIFYCMVYQYFTYIKH
jgi:hypothetical protein